MVMAADSGVFLNNHSLFRYMLMKSKETLSDQIKEIINQARAWLKLEVEYTKLTLAEKLTMLAGALVLIMVCLLIGFVVLILLSQSLVDLFQRIMSPALAHVTVSGILILLMIIIYLVRRPLLLNPISRFISKLFLDK